MDRARGGYKTDMLGPPAEDGRPPRPLAVAHRAGNDLARLRAAEARGFDVVEADVRLFRGRLEVRHHRTVGPLPVLWDRWDLAPPWRPRLGLDQLLAAADVRTHLLLDLKGSDLKLSALLADHLEVAAPDRILSVCSRDWRLLEPFRGSSQRVVLSAGTSSELRRLLDRDGPLDGVSVHHALLSSDTVRALRSITDLVMAWPVRTAERAERLLQDGVDGLISQDFDLLATLPGWASAREEAA